MKVTAIEEAQDLNNIKVNELICSLQTFKMALNDRSEKTNKSIVFFLTLKRMKIKVKKIYQMLDTLLGESLIKLWEGWIEIGGQMS